MAHELCEAMNVEQRIEPFALPAVAFSHSKCHEIFAASAGWYWTGLEEEENEVKCGTGH